MKITLCVAQKEGKFPNERIWYTLADSYEKANKIVRGSIDRKTYSFIKALEENKEFEIEVKKVRSEYDIPAEGYTFEGWTKYKSERNSGSIFRWKHIMLTKGAKQIIERFKIPFLLQEDLVYIIIGNYIYLPLTRLSLEVPHTLLPVWGITDNEYDKFYQSFREKVAEIDTRLAILQEAEDNYYITAKYLLELANRAYQLFNSSEVEERRQLIKLVLSNLRVEDKLVRYDAIKPFDTILNYADSQLWLRGAHLVRTYFNKYDPNFYLPQLKQPPENYFQFA